MCQFRNVTFNVITVICFKLFLFSESKLYRLINRINTRFQLEAETLEYSVGG